MVHALTKTVLLSLTDALGRLRIIRHVSAPTCSLHVPVALPLSYNWLLGKPDLLSRSVSSMNQAFSVGCRNTGPKFHAILDMVSVLAPLTTPSCFSQHPQVDGCSLILPYYSHPTRYSHTPLSSLHPRSRYGPYCTMMLAAQVGTFLTKILDNSVRVENERHG
jgi:hypothetical protein